MNRVNSHSGSALLRWQHRKHCRGYYYYCYNRQYLVWPIVATAWEAWTLNKELGVNMEAFEMQCYTRCVHISFTEHVTNDEVLWRQSFDGSVTRKLKYFGHVTRHDSLEKDIMLGTMPGTRRQGRQRRQWLDNITQWSEWTLSAWRKNTHLSSYNDITWHFTAQLYLSAQTLRNVSPEPPKTAWCSVCLEYYLL